MWQLYSREEDNPVEPKKELEVVQEPKEGLAIVHSLVYNGKTVGKRITLNGKKYDMLTELAVDCVGYLRMVCSKVDVERGEGIPVQCVNGKFITDNEFNAIECTSLKDFIAMLNIHPTYRIYAGIGADECLEEDCDKTCVIMEYLRYALPSKYSTVHVENAKLKEKLKSIQITTASMISCSKLFSSRDGICESYLYQATKVPNGYFIQCLGQTFVGYDELSDECEYDFCVFVPEEYFTSSNICRYIVKNFKQYKCNYVGGSSRKVTKKSIVETVIGVIKDLPSIWNSAKNVDKDVQNVFVWVKTATDLQYLGFEKTSSKYEMSYSAEIAYQLKTEDSENRYFVCVGTIGDPTDDFSVDSDEACVSVLGDMGEEGTFHSVGYLVI